MKKLDLKGPVSRVQGAVDGRVTLTTNLLVINARWGSGKGAAAVANGFARVIKESETRDRRAQFQTAEKTLRQRFRKTDPQNPITRAAYEDRIARLDALSELADPVDIVRAAGVPNSPVSPKPLLNAGLGLVLGLTLGILAAFLRDALDRRLRGSHDVQEHLKLPVLGHVGDPSLGRVPAPNGQGGLTEAEVEAFRILRVNLDFTFESTPQVVAITSGLPEEGKSTVAISLASVSAAAGKRTALVECDLRRPSVSGRLGISRAPGLTEYLAGQAELTEIRQELPFSNAVGGANGSRKDAYPKGVVCVTAGDVRSHAGDMLGSERFKYVLDRMREEFDLVVLDTAPLLSVVDTRELLPLVDGVLLCVRASRTTREEADATKEALSKLPPRETGLVITGLRPTDEAYYGYYSYEADHG
jgi:succinoglycan biosynthesis transport protein ExoP